VLHTTTLQTIRRSLVIRGGYPNCTASDPNPDLPSLVSNANGRALIIEGLSDPRYQVLLENLLFVGAGYWNGQGDAPTRSSGGIVVRGPVEVTLRGGGLQTVHAVQPGGAIRMQATAGGVPEVHVQQAEIALASSGNFGGAIACEAGTLRISDSILSDGYTPGRGGAISANACRVVVHRSVLRDNHASAGGALSIYADHSTTHRLLVEDSLFFKNDASNGGGAISLYRTFADLDNAKLVGNSSIVGAAMNVHDSFIVMRGQACTRDQASTASNSGCSGLGGHILGQNERVVNLNLNSTMQMTGTTMAGNSSSTTRSWLIHSKDSTVLLQNVVLTANTLLENLIKFKSSGQLLRLDHVSIHANTLRHNSPHIDVEDLAPPNFQVFNSIFEGYSRGFPFLTGVFSPDLHCMVTDQPLAVTGGGHLTNDPGIAADGIHLKPGSAAIDFCEPSLLGDLDGDERPYDDPNTPNASHFRVGDAGADEWYPDQRGDRIFGNRFQ
jgi:hypothetical protein